MALRREQAEQVIKEALSKGLPVTTRPDYHKRSSFEALSLFPVIRHFVKINQLRWWLSVVRYWYDYLSPEEIEFALNLMLEKNLQYGCTQLYTMGTLGVLLRSLDKVERLKTIDAGIVTSLVKSESRKDSEIDLFNYSILAILVLRKELQ